MEFVNFEKSWAEFLFLKKFTWLHTQNFTDFKKKITKGRCNNYVYPRGGEFFLGGRQFFGKPNGAGGGKPFLARKKGGKLFLARQKGGKSIFWQTRLVKKWFSLTQELLIFFFWQAERGGGAANFFWQAKTGSKLFLASQKGGASIFWQNILEIHHPGGTHNYCTVPKSTKKRNPDLRARLTHILRFGNIFFYSKIM